MIIMCIVYSFECSHRRCLCSTSRNSCLINADPLPYANPILRRQSPNPFFLLLREKYHKHKNRRRSSPQISDGKYPLKIWSFLLTNPIFPVFSDLDWLFPISMVSFITGKTKEPVFGDTSSFINDIRHLVIHTSGRSDLTNPWDL